MNQLGVLVELFYSAALESQSLITRVAMVQQGDKSQGLPLKYHHPTLQPCWRSVFISFLVGSQMTEKTASTEVGKVWENNLKKGSPVFQRHCIGFKKGEIRFQASETNMEIGKLRACLSSNVWKLCVTRVVVALVS